MSEDNNQHQINESFCFKWCDYQNHLSGVVRQLLDENCMVDVTISAEGEHIHAHRIVLSACSTLFKELLSQVTDDHPTIILSGIPLDDVRAIVEFTYQGEVRIPEENIANLLEAARFLQINGLMEYDANDSDMRLKHLNDNDDVFQELNEMESKVLEVIEKSYEESYEQSGQSATEENSVVKKRKRRFAVKREYSDEMLATAINNLRDGQTLIEASTKNNIPRSTLYMRAKALGINLNASRSEYPAECMGAAIKSVIGGSSLQQAAEMYGIPKTVLWRRIQKQGYQIFRSDMKRSYGSDKREAAVKALERGENLSKVANDYQIPKTTLFRDKTRLVNQGKLPMSCWKKRKTENEEIKKLRLEEAVAACKNGKMSQAAASVLYHIPKTTIWRRLQQENKKSRSKRASSNTLHENVDKLHNGDENTYFEVTSGIPIAYIEGNGSIAEESVIILTNEEVEELNLQGRTQIIVKSNADEEFITETTPIEDDSNYNITKS